MLVSLITTRPYQEMLRGLPSIFCRTSNRLSRPIRGCLPAVHLSILPQAQPSHIQNSDAAYKNLQHFDHGLDHCRFFSNATEADQEVAEGIQNYEICRRSAVRNVAIIAHVDHGKSYMRPPSYVFTTPSRIWNRTHLHAGIKGKRLWLISYS